MKSREEQDFGIVARSLGHAFFFFFNGENIYKKQNKLFFLSETFVPVGLEINFKDINVKRKTEVKIDFKGKLKSRAP